MDEFTAVMNSLLLMQEQAQHTPFMMAAVAGAAPKVDKGRILEAVIIACVSSVLIGMGGWFIALPVIQEQLAQQQRAIVEVRLEIKEARVESKEERLRSAMELRALSDRQQRMEIEAARMGARPR